jgi:hypothetical protein
MDRITFSVLALVAAALTALVLDYIAHNDLGAPQETIRMQALILAAIIGIGLLGSFSRKGRR